MPAANGSGYIHQAGIFFTFPVYFRIAGRPGQVIKKLRAFVCPDVLQGDVEVKSCIATGIGGNIFVQMF